MKISSIIELVLVNAILIYLISLVRSDQASRLQYWDRIGFSPSSVYSAFTLRYPAVSGSVSIPGLPTLDWVQILFAILVVMDIYYVASALGRRRRQLQDAGTTPATNEVEPPN